MENKARFWTGVGLIVPEVVIATIYGLSFVNWSFISSKLLLFIGLGLYNSLAVILIWFGSRKKKDKEPKLIRTKKALKQSKKE